MRASAGDALEVGLEQVMTAAREWLGGQSFPDDLSLIAVEV